MLKTNALYNFLNYFDECPIKAFKLTEADERDFAASVKKLVLNTEQEIRDNILNLSEKGELIYLTENLEVLIRYRGWLLPNCWEGLARKIDGSGAEGLWLSFVEHSDEHTKGIIKDFNYRFELALAKNEDEINEIEYTYNNQSEDISDIYSPSNFRELFLGQPEANIWSLTYEQEEKLEELFSTGENATIYFSEVRRQRILGDALIYVWELIVKMYERRSGQPTPNSFLHEYYTQYSDIYAADAPKKGSGYERLGIAANNKQFIESDSEGTPEGKTILDNTIYEESEQDDNEIYSHCTRAEDVERLEDLCSKCPIPKTIESGIGRIKAEISSHKETDMPAMFSSYCEEKLAYHSNLAAQLANELNNPIQKWNSQKMSNKFWNKEVAKLYRGELIEIASRAQPILSNPFGMPSDLYDIYLQMQKHRAHEAKQEVLAENIESKKSVNLVKEVINNQKKQHIDNQNTNLFDGLLRQIDQLTLEAILFDEGLLLTIDDKIAAAPSATASSWVALGWALSETGRLRENGYAAFQRALVNTYGAKVSEKAMQDGPGIRAKATYKRFLSILIALK